MSNYNPGKGRILKHAKLFFLKVATGCSHSHSQKNWVAIGTPLAADFAAKIALFHIFVT
jgi:hypothetical protein